MKIIHEMSLVSFNMIKYETEREAKGRLHKIILVHCNLEEELIYFTRDEDFPADEVMSFLAALTGGARVGNTIVNLTRIQAIYIDTQDYEKWEFKVKFPHYDNRFTLIDAKMPIDRKLKALFEIMRLMPEALRNESKESDVVIDMPDIVRRARDMANEKRKAEETDDACDPRVIFNVSV